MSTGFRMAAVAAVSAVIAATIVIGAGQAWLAHSTGDAAASGPRPTLVRTSG